MSSPLAFARWLFREGFRANYNALKLLGPKVLELSWVLTQYVLVQGAIRPVTLETVLHRALIPSCDVFRSSPLSLYYLSLHDFLDPLFLLH